MRKPSNKTKILNILKKEGRISNHYCIDTRLTTRLGAEIFKLRQEGYDIKTTKGKGKDTVYTLKPTMVERYYVPDLGKEIIRNIYT